MSRRKIVIAAVILAVVGAVWALNEYWLLSDLGRPPLAATLPLQPSERSSVVAIPVAIELDALRAALDSAAPRDFKGKRENPMSLPFGKTDIGWTVEREEFTLTGKPEGLTLTAKLSGVLRLSAVNEEAKNSLNIDPERAVQEFIIGVFRERGKVHGQVMLSVKPNFLANWRIDPRLSGHVSIPEGGLSIGGMTIDVAGDVKSAIDRAVYEQLEVLQKQLREDRTIELAVRREWERMCRSISLAAVAAGNPNLYLQLKPVRAYAAHPIFDEKKMTATLGVEMETRIASSPQKPDCPFPSEVEIVPPVDEGRFTISTPIEVPFTEVNRILGLQLIGKKFPENAADAPAQVTVLRADVAASGAQLLISLLVEAREQKTWFGFNARAVVYIWVRPQLDLEQQTLRLTDMTLDVRSNAAFGLFGAAARAAIPYLQQELEKYTVVDLKPYTASARSGLETLIADFDKQDDGVNASANIRELGLISVEFDSKTLRITVEAEGAAKVAVTKLPAQP